MPASQDLFVAEFRRWRDLSGLSRAALAKAMGYSRPYVSKVESGSEHASREFVKTADAALNTGGALQRAWREQEIARAGTDTKPGPVAFTPVIEPAKGLLVEHDHAELCYDGDTYWLTQRRRLINNGSQPITRYLIRISVDRYPSDPERSERLYRDNPLTWAEINLHAWHGDDRAEQMQWSVRHDRDSFKEAWLHFAGENGRFPLYPGDSTWIEYTYTVRDDKWGHWFRRAVRLSTRRLSVRLDFPADLDPAVWGLHTSMTAESMPFQNAIHTQETGGRRIYSWSTDNPPLDARYRLEWHFRSQPHEMLPDPPKPSTIMKELGIVQDGDLVLRKPARQFTLPAEAEDARRIISELQSAIHRVAKERTFAKRTGIAAPQIGIERAAAIVCPPGQGNVKVTDRFER